jgi:ABC-type multidrug transport system ATPase subunit/DNA-directed RNA polymerase subunit RPC12/RpoP
MKTPLEFEYRCPHCGTEWALNEEEEKRPEFVCDVCKIAFNPQQLAMPGEPGADREKNVEPLARALPKIFPSSVPRIDVSNGSALVQIEEVTKSFGGKVALKNISFTVPSGQICGLLGPNGAGKTTLFRLLMGILKATRGRLLIDGIDAFEKRVEVKRLIGFLPDEPVFYSYLSGREVLELSAAMHGLDVKLTMDRVVPVMTKLRLAEDIDHYAEDYSRGMKKKLGLLLAMIHSPRLLVLDEPTNGLDVESTHLFYDLIVDQARMGTTVLFSTHLMDHVAKLCSHAVIINEGTLVAKGSLDELRSKFGQASLEDLFLQLTARPPQI